MKKVLALVLAIAMMSTVAFAAVVAGNTGDASETVVLGASDVELNYVAGESIKLGSGVLSLSQSLNTKFYSIKKVSYNTGKAYVDAVTLNSDEDEDELKVAFKKDYSIDKMKDVKMTIELRGKHKDVPSAEKDVKINIHTTYGYTTDDINIDPNGDLSPLTNVVGTDDNIKKIAKFVDDGMPYGNLEFSASDVADIEVRVYDKDKAYLGYNFDADKKVLVANADSDAEISFLSFPAKPAFNSTATVYFYDVDENGFVYELTSEGKIKKSNAKWSDDDGCWVLKTRTLGSYVFSDKALVSAAAADGDTTPDTDNPDTGANDVVGIAAALAVVSLVAAGAVSLKK